MKAPLGAMSSLEFLSTATAIAGLVFVFSGMYHPTQHPRPTSPEQSCPDIQVRHSVGSSLKTGVKAVDGCDERLNIKIY